MSARRAAIIAWATRAAVELADILETPEADEPAPVKRRRARRAPVRPAVVTDLQRAQGLRLAREMGLHVDDDAKKTG